MPIAKSVEDTVLGEALAGDYADILGVVSVIDNRSKQLGVSYQDVVAAKGQFDAYGKAMPAGVSKYRGLVDKAIAEVQEKGPVHSATFYATPAAAKGLPKGLAFETKTAGHQYYSDPQNRAIGTAQGYKTPDPTAMATPQGLTDVAGQPAGTLYDVAEAAPSIATPSDQMGLLADFSKAPVAQAQTAGLLSDVAAPAARGTTGFKSPTVEEAFGLVAPEMRASFKGIQRGLLDPSAYTVTSTAEPRGRGTPSKSHVVDKAAVDMRTRGLDQKALDTLAVAAMYDPGVKSISWDHTGFAPHAHFGTTTPYGKGLQAKSDISKLSPDVQEAMRSWDAKQKGLIDDFAPMVPESIAPTPIDRAAPVETVERGFLADVPGYGQAAYAAPVGTVERGTLGPASEPGLTDPSIAAPVGPSYNIDQAGLTAPGFTGPAARSVSTQSIGPGGLLSQAAPSGTSYGPAGQTPAGFAELGAIGKTGRVGVAAPAPESILGPIAMPTQQPYFAPVAPRAPTAPAMVEPVAPVAPQQTASQQASAPAPSMASAGDVWGGRAQTGRATNGNAVSRNPDGTVSMTSSKYGYTEVDGQYRGKVDPSTVGRVGIAGPLSGQGITGKAQGKTTARSGLGQGMRSVGGSIAGGLVGGLLGPAGGILGAYLGKQMAMGKNPFSGLLGRSQFSDFAGMAMPTPAAAQRSFQQGFTPGLGFPDAPNGPSSQGGLTSYGEAASRGDFGGQAQSAADNPGKGLY